MERVAFTKYNYTKLARSILTFDDRGEFHVSLLNRIRNVLRANLNDTVSRAEDPEKALDQMISGLAEDLVKVRQATALAIAAQNRLQAECDQRTVAVQEWQQRAERAVDREDDDLAREALTQKLQYQREADQLRDSLQAQSSHLDELKGHVQKLETRVQQAVLQRDQLVARYRTAEATQSLEQKLSDTGELGTTMDRLEDETVDAEARAAAYHELSRDSLEGRFTQLDQDPNVDGQLAELKHRRLSRESAVPRVQPGGEK
jgi:phage shock protein A